MLNRFSAKQYLLFGTALTGLGVIAPDAARADCLPDASGLIITCQLSDTDGYQTTSNGVTINVNAGATVGTGAATPSPLLSAGSTSVVDNTGTINSGAVAISLGGGSTVNNAASGPGIITGAINFGAAGTGQTNALNNLGASSTITGNISSAGGAFNLLNAGTITGTVSSSGNTTITNSGTLTGNVTLGAGNDTITNTGTMNGTVDMGSGTNMFSASNGAQLPTLLTAAAAGTNTVNLGTGGGTVGAITNFDVMNVNANPGTTWTLNQPVSLADRINVNSGLLAVNNPNYLGSNVVVNNSSGTSGAIAQGGIIFSGTGTYSGNMSGTGTVYVGSGTTTFSGANTYTGGTYLNFGGTLTVTGGQALSDTGTVFVGGTGTLNVAQTETIGALSNDTVFGGAGSVTLTGGNLLINSGSFSGVISGANGIGKVGTGTLTLSGANTFAGAATVSGGTLILSGGSAIGDTTPVVVNSGTLQVGTAETIGDLSGTGGAVVLNAGLTTGGDNASTTYAGVISGTGSLTKNGTGTFTLTGANTYSGGTTVNTGTLAGNSTSLEGNILVNSPGILLFNQTTNGTFAGVITGAGTVTNAGAGVLTLSGNNSTFTGTTNLNGGTLAISAANNLGSGALAFNGGTLQTTAALTLANPVTLNVGGGTINTGANTTLSGVISGAGALTKSGAATLILSGANTYTGGTTISAGTLQGTTSTLTGNIADNAALVIDNSANGSFAGNISGTGSLTTINAGTTTLTGTNTYSGATNVNGGTLVVGPTGIGDSSAVTVASGAMLQLAANETIGSLAGAGGLGGAFTLTTGGNNSSTTFSGPITGTGITKVGTGTFTLTGTGTPAALAVNAGTLAVGGSVTSPTSVNSGGTLNVLSGGALTGTVTAAAGSSTIINGTVTGNVTNAGATSGTGTVTGAFTNSGSLSPGNTGIGIFHVVNGPFTQTAAGTLNINLTPSGVAGTGYDQVLVTGTPGTAVLGGTLALNPQTGVLYVAGTNYDVVNAAGGISGSFASTTGGTISPFLSFTKVGTTGIVTLAGTQQVYRLTVSRTPYATGIGASATANQIAVANGFQGLVTGATGDAATLVTSVDNMTAAQAQSFFDQVSPEAYGAYANALYNQGELFTRQVALQMHGTPNSGSGLSLWGRGYGGWGSGHNRGYRFGTDQDIYGGALGLDYRNGGLTVGAAGGYSHDKLQYKLGNSSGRVNSWQLGGYLDYTAGAIDFDLQAAYEHGSIETTKTINVSGIANVASIARTVTASPTGHLWRVIGTVGYNAALGTGISARPFIGLDWSDGQVNSFSETGATAADLTVADIKVRRTDVVAGVDIGSSKPGGIAPYARLAYKYDLSQHNNNVSAYFAGNTGSAFTVSAVPLGRSEFDADLGLSFAAGRNFMLFAGYEGTYRNDHHSNGVSAGFRVNFGGPVAAPPPPPPPAPPPPPPPPPAPATQTCPDGSVIDATATCPAPPPPPPPAPAPERG
jgi:autotransporter-associated beta strand protein